MDTLDLHSTILPSTLTHSLMNIVITSGPFAWQRTTAAKNAPKLMKQFTPFAARTCWTWTRGSGRRVDRQKLRTQIRIWITIAAFLRIFQLWLRLWRKWRRWKWRKRQRCLKSTEEFFIAAVQLAQDFWKPFSENT